MRVDSYSYTYRPTCRRLLWISFARLLTIFIPDIILHYVGGLNTSASRIAWREKVALVLLYLLSAAFFCFWLEFLSSYFCDPEKTYDYDLVYSPESKLAGINGKAVNWTEYTGTSRMADYVVQYPHHDLSMNFPRFMLLNHPSNTPYSDPIINSCIFYQNQSAQADAWLDYYLTTQTGYNYINSQLLACPLPDMTNMTGGPCFYGSDYDVIQTYKTKGDIEYDPKEIARSYNGLPSPGNSTKQGYVILDGHVLDVTAYLVASTNIIPLSSTRSSRSFAMKRMFLPLDLTIYLYINLGRDISEYFNGNVSHQPDVYRRCLIHLFNKGVVSSYASSDCTRSNPALWATMGVGLCYFLLKMNLAYLSRVPFIHRLLSSSESEYSTTTLWPHTLLLIPCYSESSDILKQTFDALSRTTYDDDKKLLVFICDGVVTHPQSNKYTHLLLLESLGYSSTEEPNEHPYVSLGQNTKRLNYARVYSGFYETGRNRVPYLVVVKIGQPGEEVSVPGNRGKRDSLVMIMSFLERCLNLEHNMITSLDYELFNQCFNVLGIDPRYFKYVMVTDADVQVRNDVVQKLVTRLEKDRTMLAVSGHIRPANPEENLTTMLQIFPAYTAYFSGLAYEACLKSVMTLSCGLVMYKIWTHHDPQQSFNPSQYSNHLEDANPFNDTVSLSSISTISTISTTNTDPSTAATHFSSHPKIRPCCIHPTVLRGFATPRADTMHMQNVLLLGEDRSLSTVLLASHPQHRLGFEPEAVGYATLPTDFFSLQGAQTRFLRARFHNQWEMQRVAWRLGFVYWLLSTAELFDMIFSTPIIVYLYSVFARSLQSYGKAYVIIVCSFTGLITLHILFFAFRRQFRYILWFMLYCLVSVPLFAVWFPLLAVWQSNHAHQWYDIWPTSIHRGHRTHGIIDDRPPTSDLEKSESMVTRMKLKEYEIKEAMRVHQAAEAALDSNFIGFSCISDTHTHPVEEKGRHELIASLPSAQIRDGIHSTRMSTANGSLFPLSPLDGHTNNWKSWYVDDGRSVSNNGFVNPFADIYVDNPFDDEYAVHPKENKYTHHRPSHSQSSYYTYTSYTTNSDIPIHYTSHINDNSTVPTSLNSSGFAKIPTHHDIDTHSIHSQHSQSDSPQDRTSTLSIVSNTFSIASTHTQGHHPQHHLPRHHLTILSQFNHPIPLMKAEAWHSTTISTLKHT